MIGDAMARKPVADLESTYRTLLGIIEPYASTLAVVKKTPRALYLASKTSKTQSGSAVWFGGVEIMKNYVSFHLIPVYVDPALLAELSPALRKRMQGKSCFNFTSLDPVQASELVSLTQKGYERFTRQFP